MESIIDEIRQKMEFPYFRMKDLKAAGIQTRNLRVLLEGGRILKVKPGLYRETDPDVPEVSLLDVCRAQPQAVICLASAAVYYDLTTLSPAEVQYAVPQGVRAAKILHPPVRCFHFETPYYKTGAKTVATAAGLELRIYTLEKTLCDLFRFRNKTGLDLAREALSSALAKNRIHLPTLYRLMGKLRIKNAMEPYVRALAT